MSHATRTCGPGVRRGRGRRPGTARLPLGLRTELGLPARMLTPPLGAGRVAVRRLWPDTGRARGPYRAFMVTQYANADPALGPLVGK